MKTTYKCKLCKTVHEGHGHFLSKGGYACDDCNMKIVLPARIEGVHY